MPVIIPPLAMPEALRPKPPEEGPSGCDKLRFVIVVLAKVDVPVTFKLPETDKAVADALPNVEVAETFMEVKFGLLEKVIWVEVPIKTFCPPVMERLELETVSEPKVVVPSPPFETGITPVIAMVEVPLIEIFVEPVSKEAMSL